MMSELLPGYLLAALEDGEESLRSLLAGPLTLRDLNALCDHLRTAGIAELLIGGRSALLRRRLHQSARAFAHGLAGIAGPERLGSKARPFFDAIAAEDLDAATDIANLSSRSLARGKEYEEDYLFIEALMHRFFVDPTGDVEPILSRWEKALAGTSDARLQVVRALVEGDAGAFEGSLSAYLSDRARKLNTLSSNRAVPGELLATEWHFCVEGVALAKLARRGGMTLTPGYRHVPPVALEPATETWRDSDWRVVAPTTVV